MIEKKVLVESTSDNIDIGFTFIVVCQPFRFIMRPLTLRFEETVEGKLMFWLQDKNWGKNNRCKETLSRR
ncbi:unnamed protein product [Trifolium pratense]|uniref:Uncharacterized protein n=1 Tax=Trifolium pratense TaxID=57577 RepID=A0ACB0LVG3_TRIPR|nr:unnamed protein product [Trifolium pratense]